MDLKNKVVLVTGGTGSFGQAFAQRVLERCQPKKLIIFSRDEMKQYMMRKRLADPESRVRYFIGDVRDMSRLQRAFQGVHIVVHAAALKIVPSLEYNPFEAVQTNVIGTENIINAALDSHVEKVIALSTDKAVNPINLYGATKLCAEKMFVAGNNYSPDGSTQFSVVRYGNVFGSRGSVVPFFKEYRNRASVPITDSRMTRFWITLNQGAEFVLRCLDEMCGGEIFIPKLPSIRIVDLAEAICPCIRHEIIGIRPGEKVHEALISRDEGLYTYEFEDKFTAYPKVVASRKQIEGGKSLTPDFEGYTSDRNNHWLSVNDLRKLVGEAEEEVFQ